MFAIGYYLVVRGNRAVLREMREEHLSGGRPQILVEADYGRLPVIDLVVRNVSGGSARDITFRFSTPIEDSSGFVVSDLPYLKEGWTSSGPGATSPAPGTSWTPRGGAARKGLSGGIGVTVKYKDLAGKPYRTRWTVNPLLYAGNRHVPREGLGDVVAALKGLCEVPSRAASAAPAGDDGRGAAEPGTRPR